MSNEVVVENSFFTAVNQLPEGYEVAGFKNYLFNQYNYVSQWQNCCIRSFYLANQQQRRVLGQLHFVTEGDTAMSTPRSLFGGIEVYEDVSWDQLMQFIDSVNQGLLDLGVRRVRIQQMAQAYDFAHTTKTASAWQYSGYRIVRTDINHHIPLEGRFEHNLHKMEKRKLQKARKMGLQFKIASVDQLTPFYHYLKNWRHQRQIPMPIELPELRMLFQNFPDRYFICGVTLDGEWLAASVLVRVNEEILYNFIPAYDPKYSSVSPVVFLMDGIYDFALENDYRVLDLGRSSTETELQLGLIQFKERLGGLPSLKFTFEKEL